MYVLISCCVYVAILSGEECHVWFISCFVYYLCGCVPRMPTVGNLMYAAPHVCCSLDCNLFRVSLLILVNKGP